MTRQYLRYLIRGDRAQGLGALVSHHVVLSGINHTLLAMSSLPHPHHSLTSLSPAMECSFCIWPSTYPECRECGGLVSASCSCRSRGGKERSSRAAQQPVLQRPPSNRCCAVRTWRCGVGLVLLLCWRAHRYRSKRESVVSRRVARFWETDLTFDAGAGSTDRYGFVLVINKKI